MLRTLPPLTLLLKFVRLACVRHAASVYPEPGSNSPLGLFDSSISLDYCFTCFKSFDLNPNLFLVLESLYHSLIVNVLLGLTSKPVDHTRLPYFVNPFIS